MKQQVKLMKGDNMESLKKLPDNSIDSIVSDPPYGLSFMGKKWDYDVPSVEFWKEVYRVLKPGGHVLSFGGTRTYHRMVVNIEDAGFEIRDQVMWLYGSGFPKSHNIGKAVDKIEGNEREVVGEKTGGAYSSEDNNALNNYNIKEGIKVKNVRGEDFGKITKGQSKYEGWGTALKPANEPICVARKPLSEKTIAENVMKWGTGGINIDGCRIDLNGDDTSRKTSKPSVHIGAFADRPNMKEIGSMDDKWKEGRFPANIILDETAAELLDLQSGMLASRFFYVAKVSKKERNMGLDGFDIKINIGTLKLLIYIRKENIIWEKQDQKATHQEDMEQSIQKDIEEYGLQNQMVEKEWLWNTELYGNYIMDQCQKDFKFITEMKTNSTMIYQTLNLLIQKNTKIYIQELYGEMVKDINFVENVEKKNIKMNFTLQEENTSGYTASVKSVSLEETLNISVTEFKCSHPTLKPINLMTYLCRLITPEGGIVLDPFMGSGSTGIAAQLEGFRFVGMEMDEDYFKIAEARIEAYEEYRKLLK